MDEDKCFSSRGKVLHSSLKSTNNVCCKYMSLTLFKLDAIISGPYTL